MLCLRKEWDVYIDRYHSTISCLLWQELSVAPPQAELDCLVLRCSLATVIVPFSFTML